MTIRIVEVFTAGCSLCDNAVQRVQTLVCPSCRVDILDMRDVSTQEKATQYGVTRVPAVAVNGTLADCCQGGGVDLAALQRLGVGTQA